MYSGSPTSNGSIESNSFDWNSPILAHVTVRVAGRVIESVITRRSAAQMGLKKDDVVAAVGKATEVMIAKA